MCARPIGGIPYLGKLVERSTLLDAVCGSRPRPTLIVAPSGHGKTCLAAQIAQRYECADWLDCHGQLPDIHVLAGMLDGVRSDVDERRRRDASPICIVLDDLDLSTSPDALDDLDDISQRLYQFGCVVVATSRELPARGFRALRGFELISADDLMLSLDEAASVADLMADGSWTPDQVSDIWLASKGHAALLVVMVQAVMAAGRSIDRANGLHRLFDHLITTHANETDQKVLRLAALLKSGDSRDLACCGEPQARESLIRLAAALPLLTVHAAELVLPGDAVDFGLHDLLADHVVSTDSGAIPHASILSVIDVLVLRGDYQRAAEVVALADHASVLQFLDVNGFSSLQSGAAPSLRRLFELVSLSDVMGSPRLLALWSDVLMDSDSLEEAHSKARAARVLAEHKAESAIVAQATANSLIALRLLNRWDEAVDLLSTVPGVLARTDLRLSAKTALLRAAAPLHVLAGDYAQGEALLRQCVEEGRCGDLRAIADSREAGQNLALIPCFRAGDFAATAQAISPFAASDDGTLARRVAARGNLAAALLETGRAARARDLLTAIIDLGGESSKLYFLPVLGCALFADGEETEGLRTVVDGLKKALVAGAEAEAAQNRVYEAMLLRAAGMLEDSLTSAERAYERLCVQDFMDFRRLAAMEVAASLLALGDAAAARAWAETVSDAGFGENLHHAFRGAMILALCDRADGQRTMGVERLSTHCDHLRSGNSNFQSAMYVRAFPELLGLMVDSFGVAAIPVHMLRMVPSKSAEQALRICRDEIAPADWMALGERLLGESQFSAFLERKGRPVCHVRLFGGLSLSVGDRTILDREWKKRKARMLFAMLVSRRGQEIAREQIFDLLWPDLPADRAKNNFYVAWSAMKAALMGRTSAPGGCPYVDNSGGRCRIIPNTVRSDLDEFEEALHAAKDRDAAGDGPGTIEALERIASVYHGDLMESDPYEEWVAVLRDRYRFEFITAMLRLSELLLEQDDPCQALVYVRRAVQVDPQREDLYQAALKCHIAAGQRSAAVETFVTCKTQLADEFGLDPSAETIALYQQILVMEDRPRYDDYGLT